MTSRSVLLALAVLLMSSAGCDDRDDKIRRVEVRRPVIVQPYPYRDHKVRTYYIETDARDRDRSYRHDREHVYSEPHRRARQHSRTVRIERD